MRKPHWTENPIDAVCVVGIYITAASLAPLVAAALWALWKGTWR